MNICLFSDTYYPAINGVTTSLRMLEKGFRKRGHNVYIVTASKHKKPDEYTNLLTLSSIPLAGVPQHRISTFYSPKEMKKLRDIKPDVVHTNSEFSIGVFGHIVARELDIPLVHTFHTMWEEYMHYIIPRIVTDKAYARSAARKIVKTFMNRCTEIIVPTEAVRRYVYETCRLTDKNINVIPTGIDLENFECEKSEEQLSRLRKELVIGGEKIILYVGRVAKEKSLDKIINALPYVFTNITNAKFLIIGDGTELLNLKKMAHEKFISDKVIFAGSRPREEIGAYYALGDVFVNASTSETQGLTYIEAMASGIPILVQQAENLNGLVADGVNGYFFNSEKEFVSRLIDMLNDSTQNKSIRTNALITAQRYSGDSFAENIEDLYEKVIAGYTPRKNKKSLFKR